jgi:hypothetical protein
MFSEKDLAARSFEDMAQEAKELLAESKRLREEYEVALQREGEQRLESVEARPENVELAESLWQEAERLKEEGMELSRLSMEKKLRAAEVQHRIDVRAQIESLDNYDGVWRKATKAARN